MKTTLIVAAALAAGASAAPQILRPTSRPGWSPGGGDDDKSNTPELRKRDPQREFSIGRPTQIVTFYPNDPNRIFDCGLDAFEDHTTEAYLFCSSILRSGTATQTSTYTARETATTKTTVYTTLYPPTVRSSTPRPTSTPAPPTSTPKPPTSTPRPPTTTPKPPSSTLKTSSSTPKPPSSVVPSSTPTPTPTAGCGLIGYTKTVAAYHFDSSGTKNTWAACSAACKADAKCLSFGYGEANCMLFDVAASDNVNINPMSPYTFYDTSCPVELPVRKRQIFVSVGLGNGGISSACSCLITSGPADVTKTTTRTVTSVRVTTTQTVTRTVSLLPEDMI
ncbi:hypothetical protein P154DRAFT_72664 [Amniculicola lignicola CBS 123094]|uniref:Apple domain-containing protein n=1 Tax=Amniculicola lignicola CBS 123094 TaxID=1392246 RepID=A0A6A5WQ64_9PLEO|nr:hypothetical protein P154DRAFT_72664 [Amniculicola lignicola CBS 123094]